MKPNQKDAGPPYDGGDYRNATRKASERGLEVPFNWDRTLIEVFGKINKARDCLFPVRVIYAADRVSVTGSGRGANSLPERPRPLRDYVRLAHEEGIEFHTLWNAPFLDGREWDPDFQDRLHREADEMAEADVDCIKVTHPALQHFLRCWQPTLKVGTSVNNHIDSVEKARQLVEAGDVDDFMLSHRNSRDFPLIRALREVFPGVRITVLGNESCLPDCSWQIFHQASLACSSRCGGCAGDPDYCHMLCARRKLQYPLYVLRSTWFRPEDIHYAFEAGANLIKLAGRTESSQWIGDLVTAYSTGHYEGDVFRFVEKSGLTNPRWEAMLGRPLPPCRYTVDNRALDGFIKPFVEGNVPCVRGHHGCGGCNWCGSFMDAVSLPENRAQRLSDVCELLAVCAAGRMGVKSAVLQAA